VSVLTPVRRASLDDCMTFAKADCFIREILQPGTVPESRE
jgi:hypothetical protein